MLFWIAAEVPHGLEIDFHDRRANLVNGDPEELRKVAFTPGSSEVAPPQQQRLDQLRTALNKRPEPARELPAPYAQDAGRPALQRQRARAAMIYRLKKTLPTPSADPFCPFCLPFVLEVIIKRFYYLVKNQEDLYD